MFELTAQAGVSRILPDKDTPTWGFNGAHLGPTLRAREGQKVKVVVRNDLPEVTTVHWHGMHLPAQYDGGPHQPIATGGTWTPSWTVKQQAATLWYHPHPHGHTSSHAYRGLAGFFLVDDANPNASVLPQDYGVDDIPLVIQDRRFTRSGALDERDLPDLGLLGDTCVVNGIVNPHLDAARRRIRLRILNGATMRLFNLRFADGRPFLHVASDGGLLDSPVSRTTLPLSPGERAEIVIDLTPREKVLLQAVRFEDNLGVDQREAPDFGLQQEFDVLSITGPDSGSVPAALPTSGMNPAARGLPDVAGARTRVMELKWFQINGRQMDMKRVDEVIDHHGVEIWEIRNPDNWLHNFHVHDTQFQVISMLGGSQTRLVEGWKDTLLLPPGAVARVALSFTDFESDRWPYMYHCHLMFHEDQGMMGQFMVVGSGQAPAGGFPTDTQGASGSRASDFDDDNGAGDDSSSDDRMTHDDHDR